MLAPPMRGRAMSIREHRPAIRLAMRVILLGIRSDGLANRVAQIRIISLGMGGSRHIRRNRLDKRGGIR